MLNAAVQVDLIRRADVEQQSLELGPQGRWQETVPVCGKINRAMSASVIARAYMLFQEYVTQFARVITGSVKFEKANKLRHDVEPWQGINEGKAYRQWPPL